MGDIARLNWHQYTLHVALCVRDAVTSALSRHFTIVSSLAGVGNLKQPVLPYNPRTEPSLIGYSQLYVMKNLHAASITNNVTKGVSFKFIKYPHHIPVPPSPLHYFLAALGYRPQGRRTIGLLVVKNRRRTRKKRGKRSRCMSFIARHLTG